MRHNEPQDVAGGVLTGVIMSAAASSRPVFRAVLSSTALVVALVAAAPPAEAVDDVVFADPDLQRAVNASLSWERAPDAPVTTTEAASIEYLYASEGDGFGDIDNLGGIEALVNLTSAWLGGNRILDARPLAGLAKLETADLSHQRITLPALTTTTAQSNPLRQIDGVIPVPTSDTAVVSSTGKSWRLPVAGTHTLTWQVWGDLGSSGWFEFSGIVTQTSTGPSQLSLTPIPTVSGTARVGSKLTAVTGTWDAGVGFTYQWLGDGIPIPGAQSRTLVLAAAQQHERISVAVTGSKPGFAAVARTSTATPKAILAPVPTISGTVKYGEKLTVRTGTWTTGTTLRIQWYADHVAIPDADSRSFVLTTAQSGKNIVVKVAGRKSGYAATTMTSATSDRVLLLRTSSRASVASAYKRILAPGLRVTTGWTGSTRGCVLGSESAASQRATLNAVNVVRALNQLDGVRFVSSWRAPALRNSLMMQARNQITHYPSRSGACWSSSGASAAARSNLYLGSGFSGSLNYATGARAVVGYMDDPGPSNVVAGHRRWILEPTITAMGTGSTSKANTLTVMGTNGPVTSRYNAEPDWMEWPSAGWFPKQLNPEGLWSLSSSDPGADFRNARVTVTNGSGTKLSVRKYTVVDGYGPNTITFQVSGVVLPKGSSSRSYTVSVTGIRGAAASTYRYTVKMFDPYG